MKQWQVPHSQNSGAWLSSISKSVMPAAMSIYGKHHSGNHFTHRVGIVLPALLILLLTACGQPAPLTLSGTVEAEASDIVTEVSGRITELLAVEGQPVIKGDVLARLDGSLQALTVKQLEEAVAAKEARLTELQNGSRSEQIDQARFAADAAKARYEEALKAPDAETQRIAQAQVDISNAAVEAAEVQATHATRLLADAEILHGAEALSDAAYKDAIDGRDAAMAALDIARRQLDASLAQLALANRGAGPETVSAAKAQYDQAAAQLAQLENGTIDTTLDVAEADLAQSKAALAQGQLMLEKYILLAPCDGTVTLVSFQEGEVINAGAAIGTVSRMDDLSVRLYIPQKHLAALHLGDALDLTATALPGKRIPGTVTFISDKAEYTPRNTETTSSKESTVFRFKVTIPDAETGLKPGMSLEAAIPGAFADQ